ncbi:hypothetical protein JTB14_016234 [Gonioctena quinquepunctata]|nr:hypothetical protein JTB14_016234 [Gonioctena quinquepunctata]
MYTYGNCSKAKIVRLLDDKPPHRKTQFFAKICSSDTFLQILGALHFVNNENFDEKDSLRKVRPIVDSIRTKFKGAFYPFQHLALDESLILYKGRLAFKQCIPAKRHRFGIKLFDICNDNWYTSPTLFNYLLQRKTGGFGTVRSNRNSNLKFVEKKNWIAAHTDKLLAVKWCDRRIVHMLTTVFTAAEKDSGKTNHKTREPIIKPHVVLEYKQNMGVIDKAD